MAIYGYARCSTLEQNLDSQLDALKAAGCDLIFSEKLSGLTCSANRPKLNELLDHLREGDQLIVFSTSRMSRSTLDFVQILDRIAARGAYFRDLSSGLDTKQPISACILTILASLASYELHNIRERTEAGRRAAMDRGVRFGRPPGDHSQIQRSIVTLMESGMVASEVCRSLRISRSSLYRHLRTLEASRCTAPTECP